MSGGGGGGSTPSNTTNQQYIRYAPYVEARHENFLLTVYNSRVNAINNSPFTSYVDIEPNTGFFGLGYSLSNFKSLYNMFNDYMGIDVQALYDSIFTSTVNSTMVRDLISAESSLMNDDLDENVLPRLETGMRDINSVISSSFVVGKSLILSGKQKALSKFSAELKYKLIPLAHSRWATTLEWNKGLVGLYAELLKFYFTARTDIDETNYVMHAKDSLWPFTVLDFERAALGAMQGATNTKENVAGASTMQKVIGGALSGAAMGAMVGNAVSPATAGVNGATTISMGGAGWGALGGAALGAAAAYYY